MPLKFNESSALPTGRSPNEAAFTAQRPRPRPPEAGLCFEEAKADVQGHGDCCERLPRGCQQPGRRPASWVGSKPEKLLHEQHGLQVLVSSGLLSSSLPLSVLLPAPSRVPGTPMLPGYHLSSLPCPWAPAAGSGVSRRSPLGKLSGWEQSHHNPPAVHVSQQVGEADGPPPAGSLPSSCCVPRCLPRARLPGRASAQPVQPQAAGHPQQTSRCIPAGDAPIWGLGAASRHG